MTTRPYSTDPGLLLERDNTMRTFLASWGPVVISEEDLKAVRELRLSAEILNVIQAIGTIETNSIHQLGNAIAARISEDPVISEFLPRWSAEEAEHGLVLRRIAAEAASGKLSDGFPSRSDSAKAHQRRSLIHSNSKALSALAVRLVPRLDALYATFGAFQEHSVITGYSLLCRRVGSPALTKVLRAIIVQERRHFRVYWTQAALLLNDDWRAQQVVRRGMSLLWKPVGYNAMGAETYESLVDFLCPTQAERRYMCRTDIVISELPGLSGLNLMTKYVAKHASARSVLRRSGNSEPGSRVPGTASRGTYNGL